MAMRQVVAEIESRRQQGTLPSLSAQERRYQHVLWETGLPCSEVDTRVALSRQLAEEWAARMPNGTLVSSSWAREWGVVRVLGS